MRSSGVTCIAAVMTIAVTLVLGFLGTWRALDRKAAPLLRNQ
jgi:predicted lysophospholipase L1 biosynthesis ABC-type transport system permease subunit